MPEHDDEDDIRYPSDVITGEQRERWRLCELIAAELIAESGTPLHRNMAMSVYRSDVPTVDPPPEPTP